MGLLTTLLATMLYCALGYGALALFGSGDKFGVPVIVLHLVFVLVFVIHLLQIASPVVSNIRAIRSFMLLCPAGAIVVGLGFYLNFYFSAAARAPAPDASLSLISLQVGAFAGSVWLGKGVTCLLRAALMSFFRPGRQDKGHQTRGWR